MAIKILMDRERVNLNADGNPQIEELSADTRKYLDDSTTSGTWHGDPVFEIAWAGCVLAAGEHNYYDDSDFYAVVWDDAKNGPREVEYASTRGWTYANSATMDATDEVKAAYAAWHRAQAARRQAEWEAAEAKTLRLGKTVKVVKGRKIEIGTVAEIVWIGEDKYNSDRWTTKYRVALLIDGARVFTSADNVEVVAQ